MTPDSSELHRILFRAVSAALGLTPAEADVHLIRSWADEPAPEPEPSLNLCYFAVRTDAMARTVQESDIREAVSHAVSFLPCRILLTFYGPDCETWAHRCRSFLFLDGHSLPRAILRGAGLYPVPFPHPPEVLWEETGKRRRKRADLVIEARLLDDASYSSVLDETPIPGEMIDSAPAVHIHVSDAGPT